jgi:hypothetical protein
MTLAAIPATERVWADPDQAHGVKPWAARALLQAASTDSKHTGG